MQLLLPSNNCPKNLISIYLKKAALCRLFLWKETIFAESSFFIPIHLQSGHNLLYNDNQSLNMSLKR